MDGWMDGCWIAGLVDGIAWFAQPTAHAARGEGADSLRRAGGRVRRREREPQPTRGRARRAAFFFFFSFYLPLTSANIFLFLVSI